MEDLSPEEKQADTADADGFPARLKQAMGDSSIRGFARECGFSDTVLRQYLNGQSEPTRPSLVAIARTAKVSVEWLAIGKEASPTEKTAEEYVFKDPLAFQVGWLQAQFSNSYEHLLLAQVPDDSMEPTLKLGALILVDTNDRDLAAISHGIYLLKLGDRILVKRLQYVAENTLKVLSDHPAYEGFSVILQEKASGLSLMGKVVWCGQRV
jgi:transcriptional regulator with XRE-family HTH domain